MPSDRVAFHGGGVKSPWPQGRLDVLDSLSPSLDAPRFPDVLTAPRRGKPATPAQLQVWRVLAHRAAGERLDVGMTELGRAAGVSEATAWRAVHRFAVLNLVTLHRPAHPGRGYRIGVEMRWRSGRVPLSADADPNGDAAISLQQGIGQNPESQKLCSTDAIASARYTPSDAKGDLHSTTEAWILGKNGLIRITSREAGWVIPQGDPDGELDPLRARRRVLGKVRDHVRSYPGVSWLARDRIVSGVGAALAKRWPVGHPPIARRDADEVARAIIAQLDCESGYSQTLRRACSFGGHVVAVALDAARQAARLRVEAELWERAEAERECAAWVRLGLAWERPPTGGDGPRKTGAVGFRGQEDVCSPYSPPCPWQWPAPRPSPRPTPRSIARAAKLDFGIANDGSRHRDIEGRRHELLAALGAQGTHSEPHAALIRLGGKGAVETTGEAHGGELPRVAREVFHPQGYGGGTRVRSWNGRTKGRRREEQLGGQD